MVSAVVFLVVLASLIPLLTNRLSPPPSQTFTNVEQTFPPLGNMGNSSLWLTYHRDNSRTGFDPDGTVFRSARQGWVSPVDGAVYAEPLIDGGRLFAATENNSVFALSDSDGRVEWVRNLGAPVPGSDLPCGNIDPSGITGTPVMDPSSNSIFVVAFLRPEHQHWLFALDMSSGGVKFSRPIDPANADPLIEQQRAALSLSNGTVYVPFGGLNGDCGSYHGWIVGVRTDNSGVINIDAGELYALNATNDHVIFKSSVGSVAHFSTPSAGDGQIFVGAQGKVVSFVLE
jgi:outer membrane protein assembly factor BamB